MKHVAYPHLHERMIQVLAHLGRNLGFIDKTALMKLLVLSDRKAIKELEHPVTYDDYRALFHGPAAADIEQGLFGKSPSKEWTDAFEFARTEVKVKDAAHPNDLLSDAEVQILDQILSTYSRLSRDELISLTHKFPEWIEAWGKKRTIPMERILAALKMTKTQQERALSSISIMRRKFEE